MPELPEVEVLVRHLNPLLKGRIIRGVTVHREKVVRPDTPRSLARQLDGARFEAVNRRAKFLVFQLSKPTDAGTHHATAGRRSRAPNRRPTMVLLGHLGMTGRMYLQPANAPLPRHAAVSLDLGRARFVYEDTRYFGRLTTDVTALGALGPEPLGDAFTAESFANALKGSAQPIKVRLLDQSLVAGIGNIYASEALFRAGISPRTASRRLRMARMCDLHKAIRHVLEEAIARGSTIALDFAGQGANDGLFYYGQTEGGAAEEALLVYDREGKPCVRCRTAIRRIIQAARSTYYCPTCQRG